MRLFYRRTPQFAIFLAGTVLIFLAPGLDAEAPWRTEINVTMNSSQCRVEITREYPSDLATAPAPIIAHAMSRKKCRKLLAAFRWARRYGRRTIARGKGSADWPEYLRTEGKNAGIESIPGICMLTMWSTAETGFTYSTKNFGREAIYFYPLATPVVSYDVVMGNDEEAIPLDTLSMQRIEASIRELGAPFKAICIGELPSPPALKTPGPN